MSGYLNLIQTRRAETIAHADAILKKAQTEKRGLTPAEQAEYDVLRTDIDALTEQRSKQQKVDGTNTTTELLLGELSDQSGNPFSRTRTEQRTWLPSLATFNDWKTEQRAVGTTGAFIPVMYTGRWFDQIRTRVGVLDAGPTILPVDHAGSVKVPLVNSSVTVAGYAEAATINESDPGVSSITLDPKKFGAFTLVNREALEDSNPDLRVIVENSLIKDFAVALDQQFVAGNGSGQNLTGLLSVSGVTAGPSTGTNGGSLAGSAGFGFLADTLGAYEGANNDPDKAAWLMCSRTWASVRKLVDNNNRPIISLDPTQGVRPTLWGKPVFITNNIPVNQTQGTASNASSILLADFSQIVVAVSRQVELVMSTDYAFQADQVALRVTGRFDIGVPQPTAIVKTTGLLP